ncbi:MAG: hypothetical protein U0514_00400 [Candidatus Andersenbacteria bacterium]
MSEPLTQAALALVGILSVAAGVGALRVRLDHRLNTFGRQLLCPICVCVSLTWVGLLIARGVGVVVDVTLLGVLLGASAVGIVSQLEKHWWQRRGYLAWKTLATSAGLAAAYGLATERWLVLGGALGAWLFVTAAFAARATPTSGHAAEIQEQMKNCC